MSPHGTPPNEHDWGERTIQGFEAAHDFSASKYYETDAQEMRGYFDIPEFDPSAFDRQPGQIASWVYPDLLIHEIEADLTTSPKGTSCVIRGKRGSGKTTFRDYLSVRLAEDNSDQLDLADPNDERVVIRGRQDSSGWRRFNHWATLFLPSEVDIDISSRHQNAADPTLDDLAREVIYYDDVMDLIERLEAQPSGTINVVYPDPEFRGCREVIDQTDTGARRIEVYPKSDPHPEFGPTPVSHWWFVFLLALTSYGTLRDEDGNPVWVSVHLDEVGELAPENPTGGERGHFTWEWVEVMKKMMIDIRKALVSLFAYCHFWSDVADKWRKQFNFRISMPDDRPNPIKKRSSTHPAGWDKVPMTQDLISDKSDGVGLCYSESRFTFFKWDEMKRQDDDPAPPEFRLDLGAPVGVDDVDFWFEDRLLAPFQSPNGLELRVKDGAGRIDCTEPAIREPLEAPDALDITFAGLDARVRSSVLLVDTPDGRREVAEIPHDLDPNDATPAVNGGISGD
jgi:hypothetical protein